MEKVNLIKKFGFVFAILCVMTTFCACGNTNENKVKIFGEFGFNGIYLTEYAVNNISAQRAKEITSISKNVSEMNGIKENCVTLLSDTETSEEVLPSSTLVNSILSEYSSCQIFTTYYITDGEETKQTKIDVMQGTDFKNMLSTNSFTAFSQLISKYLLILPYSFLL